MSAYAIYLRKSRADMDAEAHGEGETLARHEQALLELAKKQNLSVVKIYREIVSGDTIDARPEVQKLLDDIEQDMYDGVLVMDPDRLARGDSVDQGIIARAFRLSNTKIITPRKTYDPNSEFDEEYFEFEMFMARREYNMIKRRIQRGRIASVKEGKYICSTPPYGYDKVKIQNGKGYTLTPNAEAETVRYVFAQYLSGSGATVIAHNLDDMGIPSRSGNPWSKASIIDMLKNPVYIGKIRWSYRKEVKKSVDGKIAKKRCKNNDCIYVDGVHPAIVAEKDFQAVQRLMKSNAKKPLKASAELQNPFTGLLYCGLCGSKMTRLGENARNKYDVIKCTNRNCNCVSAPIYLVENVLLETMENWLKQHSVNVEYVTTHEEKYNILNQNITELQLQLVKLDEQVSKTFDLLEQGVYTVEIFEKRNQELAQRKSETALKIQKLETEKRIFEKQISNRNNIIPHMEKAVKAYKNAKNANEKNALLKRALSKIEYAKVKPNKKGQINNANFTLDIYPYFE